MAGVFFALGSAAVFGVSNILIRRGVLLSNSRYLATVSIFAGLVFFIVVAAVTGDLFQLGRHPWQAYALFAAAGVVHLAFGRTWLYRSIQLIGSTRAQIITDLNVVVTVVLALIVFRETVTPVMAVGIALCVFGPILLGAKEPVRNGELVSRSHLVKVDDRTLYKAVLFAMGTALFWGTSTILIKLALNKGGPPILGSFIFYLAASMAVSPSVFSGAQSRKEMLLSSRAALRLGLLSGLASGIAHMLRYFSLYYGSVIVVSLVQRTSPVWTMLFALVFNRRYESFGRWVVLCNGAVMLGVVVILLS